MEYSLFITAAIVTLFVTVVFLFRGLKVIPWRFSRYIILLPYVWMLLVLFPRDIPAVVAQATGIVILALIALIVIADIVLSNFFKVKGSLGTNSSKTPQYLIELANALGSLANRRVGALVVIERKDDLAERVGAGLVFDGEVKEDVVTALFERASTVHDGAMIIREGRIRRLKTILPVAMDDTSDIRFGTRHRAALGITRDSDALAIVVSEERGQVSIANNGFLSKIESKQDLLDYLQKTLKKRI